MFVPSEQAPAVLSPEAAARLVEFARAFKAALRAVSLYPAEHPAIAETLRRIVDMTSAASLGGPLRIQVAPGDLRVDDAALARPDRMVAELAVLLHRHLVGALIVHPGGDFDAWRDFLLLVDRDPEALRADGGIRDAWMRLRETRHVDLHEIDYAEVLRERAGDGERAAWNQILAHCLGEPGRLDLEDARALAAIARDGAKLAELVSDVDRRATEAGGEHAASALARLVRHVVSAVETIEPDSSVVAVAHLTSAFAQLPPDSLSALLPGGAGDASATAGGEQSAGTNDADSSAGDPFTDTWKQILDGVFGSATDASPVSSEYSRELSRAVRHAVSIEHANTDAPERIGAWLATVDPTALRSLDIALILDLLRVETDDRRWAEMLTPIVALLEDLLLVGDFDPVRAIVHTLVHEASTGASTERRQSAVTAIDMLVAGPMMRSIGTHLAVIDDEAFAVVQALCVLLGEVLVKPLAEALSTEENERARDRLTTIVLAFGTIGRRAVERLKGSPNAIVRRTAIVLLREFGGDEALPELTELLKDEEPQVQREAVRAMLNIGSERAYRTLEQALATGTSDFREALLHAVVGMRRERASPLFAYILRHTDHRGPLATVYLRAIESLGILRDPASVGLLDEVLHRGEWWAPRRSARYRAAAAQSLSRIGTPEAQAALETASTRGSRAVRAAARACLPAGTSERLEKAL